MKDMVSFSFANYITNLLWYLPGSIIPIMAINLVGAAQNAYFYSGWSLANVLFMLPASMSFSLFAEGSNSQSELKKNIAKSIKINMLILIPTVVVMLLLGDKLLLLFGKDYSSSATRLLQLLVLSAIPQSINQVFFSEKRVQKKMGMVVSLSLFVAVISLGLSYIFLPRVGIVGIGIAWLVSQVALALLVIILWRFEKKQNSELLL